MSGTTDELSKVPAASNNEEDLLSERYHNKKLKTSQIMRMMRLHYAPIVARRATI